MNISVTRLIVLVLGLFLLGASVFFGIQAMKAVDWKMGLAALIGVAVGFALVSGKGINVST